MELSSAEAAGYMPPVECLFERAIGKKNIDGYAEKRPTGLLHSTCSETLFLRQIELHLVQQRIALDDHGLTKN